MTKSLLMDAFAIRLSLDEGTEGKVIARGEFGRADLATQNGRVYPKPIYEREIKRLQANVGKRRVFGELDHPADGKTKLQRASHVITKLSMNDDGVVMGEAEILDTPNGRTLKAILQAGAEVGVSSRGFGSTKQGHDGQQMVGEDFMLRTFDFVADPAMKSAYPGIFTEDVDEDFMSAASLEESFPELAQQLRKDEREKVERALSAMLDNQREVAKEALRDEFGRKLADQLSTIREDVETSVRDELCEDPEVAGAKAVLSKIAEMVSGFHASNDDDTMALKDALKAKDLEVSKISEELENAKNVARHAIFRAQLESSVGGHPRRDSIIELVGNPANFDSLDDLRERVDQIMGEMDELGEAKEAGEIERLADENEELRSRIKNNLAAFKSDRRKFKEQIAELSDQLEQALEIGESYREEAERAQELAEEEALKAYKSEGSRGYTNSSRLMDLLEGVDNRDAVDRIIRNSGKRRVKDANLESVRNRLRGAARDTSRALVEEKDRQAGPASVFGEMSMSDFMSLAGVKKSNP